VCCSAGDSTWCTRANPPDLFFLIGNFFKLFGKKFVFDHHDANPELYEAKSAGATSCGRRCALLERLTFRFADVSSATNNSYRRIAIERGGMPPERVFVVRSGPSLERLKQVPPVESLKCGKRYLVGYVGVMGDRKASTFCSSRWRTWCTSLAARTSISAWWAAALRSTR
jgi:hypothetical protein